MSQDTLLYGRVRDRRFKATPDSLLASLEGRDAAIAERYYIGTFTQEEWYRVRVKDVTPGGRKTEHPLKQYETHSPSGFAWGYGGSGPTDLALALLADVTRNVKLAWVLHQQFKWTVVAKWPAGDQAERAGEREKWRMPATHVLWIVRLWLREGMPWPHWLDPDQIAVRYADLGGYTLKQLGIRRIGYPREG
jgi:hypothetical protein